MDIYVDATTLIALGNLGELELLTNFDGRIVVVSGVFEELSNEPATSNVERFVDSHDTVLYRDSDPEGSLSESKELLGESTQNGDVRIVAGILDEKNGENAGNSHEGIADDSVAVVSDDRRVRTVAEGLGATVTGTIGVVVRAVHEGMDPDEAKELVRRLDSRGLHTTGELRETAYRLVDEAAEKREDE